MNKLNKKFPKNFEKVLVSIFEKKKFLKTLKNVSRKKNVLVSIFLKQVFDKNRL